MNMTGNTILITGGGSGIGAALASEFHKAGNTVIIAGRRKDALEKVTATHPGMHAVVLDINDAASIAATAKRLTADFPSLNVVINNAGIMIAEDIKGGDYLKIAEDTVTTNVLGPIRLTQALLPHFLKQKSATVMFVSSGLAFVPLTATPTYSATKAAVHSYAQSLRHQLGGTGVGVVEIAPPGVQTDLMPGHAVNPAMMPLDEYIAETMANFAKQPTPNENLVERVKFLRNAEREGRYDDTFAMLNSAH